MACSKKTQPGNLNCITCLYRERLRRLLSFSVTFGHLSIFLDQLLANSNCIFSQQTTATKHCKQLETTASSSRGQRFLMAHLSWLGSRELSPCTSPFPLSVAPRTHPAPCPCTKHEREATSEQKT
jgi:hypothetical protein